MGSKNFVWVLNNPGEWVCPVAKFKYIVWQREVGENGTEHYQGFVQSWKSVRLGKLKEEFGNERVHVEKMAGTCNEARAYCMKEPRIDGPWEHGIFSPGKGARTDLAAVVGKPLREVAKDHPVTFVQYHRGLTALRDWRFELPEERPWRVIIGRPPEGALVYSIPWVYRELPMGRVREYSYDRYDYELVGVVDEQPPDWTPFVRAIYRGLIVNKIREIYVINRFPGV